MKSSTSGGEPQKPVGAGKRAPKANKACVPCRARKVKCDAAVVGIPCSSCRSRQCVEYCAPLVRKSRTRKGIHDLSTVSQTTGNPGTSCRRQSENQSKLHSTSNSSDCQSSGHTEPDLLYLHILDDAAEKTPGSSRIHTTSTTPHHPKLEQILTPRNCQSTKLSQLDEVDREYLAKKGVFDLPPPQHLNNRDTLIKTYFDYIHPFSPVISRVDFIRRYQSGDCALLLLRVMLVTTSLHTPAHVLSACGFTSGSAAQELFFSRARLLYDFTAEDDPLLMLQASIIMCMVILDHPTDRDFGYWFHNAIRLATKLNLQSFLDDEVVQKHKPREVLKLYRRIWWSLYSLDIFHVFVNPRRSRLLEDSSDIKSITEDDLEDADVPPGSSGLLSTVTPQQTATPILRCELSRIFGECLSIVKGQPQQDPRQMMHPLDAWRKSLASKMYVEGDIGTNVQYLHLQATSYRYECISCRLIRSISQRSGRTDWSEWAKQRLRSAILELDTIAMRVLASGTLEEFPISFVTTITALLALHIESALDPIETDLVRSTSRISISQTMLVLAQGRGIPVLKRALPIFEQILIRNNLYSTPLSQVPAQPYSRDNNVGEAYASLEMQAGEVSYQSEQWENNTSLDIGLWGFDFLDEWQRIGQQDFSG